MDMTTTDSLKDNLSYQQIDTTTIKDHDEFENLRSQIINQIVDHENLGIDLLKDVTHDATLINILVEVIEYADENYVNIADIDNILISNLIVKEVGYYIYLFLAVDCYNSIFPNFLNLCDISTYNQLEHYIRNNSNNNYHNVKNKVLKSLQQIIDPLLKLQNIDPSVSKDIKYKAFLRRLTYEVDLIEYGDFTKFVENFMKPVFYKNSTQILWRAL